VQVVAAGVTDPGMNALDAGFRFLPVVAELLFSAHGLLRTAQGRFVSLETVERDVIRAIRKRGEAGNAHVDTNCATIWLRLLDFARGLDAHKPFATRQADGDVFDCTQHFTAVAVAYPTQLGQINTAVGLVDLATLRKAKAVTCTFFLETRKVGSPGKKVFVSPLKVFEGLLQRLTRSILEPRQILFQSGKQFASRA